MLSADMPTATDAWRPLDLRWSNPLLLVAGIAKHDHLSINDFSPLAFELPPSIQILSLLTLPPDISEAFDWSFTPGNDKILPIESSILILRLRHVYAVGESVHARPTTVDLTALFAPRWKVTQVTEMTLSAVQPMTTAQERRLQWKQQNTHNFAYSPPISDFYSSNDTVIQLHPMEIKTWIIKVE